MAKRDKKFQNQAWTATVAGVKQWLNRVRSFSPNALMIEDGDIVRLEEFIDTRVCLHLFIIAVLNDLLLGSTNN
jgi:hypothetical protein